MKLLCDEMLKGLARWLRAAGHDTELAEDGTSDRALINHARDSGRLLLTRDRKLLEHRNAAQHVLLLDCNGIDSCAGELSKKLRIDWLHQPFTRCLLCNTELHNITAGEALQLPEDVKNGPLLRCPTCQRIYWEGGHVKRMQRKLRAWHSTAMNPPGSV